jgi:hypothetical protein
MIGHEAVPVKPHHYLLLDDCKRLAYLIVLLDLPLDLAGVHPCDEVLHVAGDQECGVCHRLWANADVTLQRAMRLCWFACCSGVICCIGM